MANLAAQISELEYFKFLSSNKRFLSFGVLLTFFASAGQAFFIAVFVGDIRQEFGLGHSEFALVFTLATLTSAATLPLLGRLLDRVDLRLYAVAVCLGMIGASLFISFASTLVVMGVAIYFLRVTGQGLMTHTAQTSMARYFGLRRGTAISIASFGQTIGASTFPIMGVALLALVGWRQGFLVVAAVYAVVLIPLVLWSLKGHAARHAVYLDQLRDRAAKAGEGGSSDGGVLTVLRDYRFYLILPTLLAPSFVMTGFIFHQVHLVEVKGWSMPFFAASFSFFAVASLITSLIFGPIVDRIGAARLLRYLLFPLMVAMLAVMFIDHPVGGLLLLIFTGINLGGNITIVGSMWAEVYGVTYLGAIRSFGQSLMVFASAMAPAIYGWWIDAGLSMETIAGIGLAFAIVAAILAWIPRFERVDN